MRQTSTRKAAEKRRRAALVARLAAEGVRCEIGPAVLAAGVSAPCIGRIGGLHERRKRSGVGSAENPANLIPACNPCNGWIEDVGNDRMRELLGEELAGWLVIRPGDDEWHEMLRDRDAEYPPLEVRLCSECGFPFVTVPPAGRLGCGHDAAPK